MTLKRFLLLLLAAFLVAAAIAPADAQRSPQPILILVSFDGWRWDYLDRAAVPNLKALAARGVRAAGLIPSFPSKTFPNLYTIVTGLYPEHHGIVSNTFSEPGFPQRFTMTRPTAKDGRWWGGEPLWVTAIRQNRLAGSMFWPGSEASIKGVRPTYWKPFDERVSNRDRVKQVLDWLALPEGRRPSFITLYFDEVDHAGHDFGPQSAQVLTAAAHLDAALGQLVSGVRELNLIDRSSIVVVSDHGMAQLSDERTIFLDDYLDLRQVDVIEWTPTLTLVPRSSSVDQIYRALKGKHPALAVYKRGEIPPALHYRDNSRIAPIVGLAEEGWTITSHLRHAAAKAIGRAPKGDHGYDPEYKSMHGLFVAAGPRVRRDTVVPEFENVHIYDFLCAILDLTPAQNDGDASATRGFFDK